MRVAPFEYVECASAAQAARVLELNGAESWLIAGGTVVVPMMKHRIIEPAVLVSIATVSDLGTAYFDGCVLRVGALATHNDVAKSPVVKEHAPLLAAACARVASPVLRNMGTIGGNVSYAEPASDPPSALVALNARVTLEGPTGSREVSAREFFVDLYDTVRRHTEVITEIAVPPQSPASLYRYLKWTPRSKEDKPLVSLAVVIELDGERCMAADIAVGGASSKPTLLHRAAHEITGRSLDAGAIRQAARAAGEEVDPFDDLQGSASFRREMVEVWVRRVLTDIAREAPACM